MTKLANGRSTEFAQVILNLLNNAHDAFQTLKVRWVRFDVKKSNGKIVLSISDSGKGIKPKPRSKIMQPFFSQKHQEKAQD